MIRFHSVRCTAVLAALFLWVAADALCQAEPTDFPRMVSLETPKYSSSFTADHRWSVELLGTALGDVTNRHVVMGGLTTGVGFYVFDNVAIQMDLTAYGFSEGRSDGAAAGITLGIRHHIFHVADNSVFLDVAGGEIEASNNIPYGGTHLNNTIQFGLGVAHPIAENCFLIGGGAILPHLQRQQRRGQPQPKRKRNSRCFWIAMASIRHQAIVEHPYPLPPLAV